METKADFQRANDPLHILLVGNNPIDLSSILEKINQIHGTRVITEIAFDLKTIFERLMNFRPNFILIDDNIGRRRLSETVESLSQGNRTKNIPITVLKNSNYEEAYGAGTVVDFILKANLSADAICSTVRNSLRFRNTRAYLQRAYRRRTGLLKRARV